MLRRSGDKCIIYHHDDKRSFFCWEKKMEICEEGKFHIFDLSEPKCLMSQRWYYYRTATKTWLKFYTISVWGCYLSHYIPSSRVRINLFLTIIELVASHSGKWSSRFLILLNASSLRIIHPNILVCCSLNMLLTNLTIIFTINLLF